MNDQREVSTTDAGDLDLSMPVAELTELDNGLRVVTLDTGVDRGDVAVIQIRIQTGSVLDTNMPGLARFTGSMTTRGSAGHSLEEIAEELDGLGAAIGIGVGRLSIDGTMKSLRENVDQVLGYLEDALLRPDFPEAQVEIVRSQMLSGLRQAKNSTRAEANRLMRETIYPADHPMHQRAIGNEESLSAIDRELLLDYHDRAFRPERGIVSVAGGFTHQEAVELIDRRLGGWTGSPPEMTVQPVEPPSAALRVDSTLPGKSQADLAMGMPSITRNDPDFYALSIANLVLGRFGLYGRLGESVRDRQGMAYYAFSNLEAGKYLGLWTVNAGVATDNIDRAIESIVAEIEQFRDEGPTTREFNDAVGSILGSLPLGMETSSSMAGVATDLVYNDLGLDFLRRFRGIINAVTIEQVAETARKHLAAKRLVTAVVSPESET